VAFLTRIEREGGRCQRRRHRPRRRSSGVDRGADRYGYGDDNDDCSYSSEERARRSYGAPGAPPPPRVLREMARGVRSMNTARGTRVLLPFCIPSFSRSPAKDGRSTHRPRSTFSPATPRGARSA
ncbi:unnamed protein product, partial [Ectocarpus sp. 8 AP-2014]